MNTDMIKFQKPRISELVVVISYKFIIERTRVLSLIIDYETDK